MKKLLSFKSIKSKMLFAFSVIFILIILIGTINYITTDSVNKKTERIIEFHMPHLVAYQDMALHISRVTGLVRGYILHRGEEYNAVLGNELAAGEEIKDNLLALDNSPEVMELLSKKEIWEEMIRDAAVEMNNREQEAAISILRDANTLSEEMLGMFSQEAENSEQYIIEYGSDIVESGKFASLIVTALIVAVIVLGVIIAFKTSRSISGSVIMVRDRMNDLAEGDLSGPPLISGSGDETGQLIQSTNTMSVNLKALVQSIQDVAETVSNQSEEMTQLANEVKSGTEQVAATMEQLAAATEAQANNSSDLANGMSMFSSRIEEASTNGQSIESYSSKVQQMTDEGSQLMGSSTAQMKKIEHIVHDASSKMKSLENQSKSITKLVSVIQDIAGQTNLLALNAAIEAARAGEHGKGFAVVADEVRILAEQVSVSVKDITQIVSSIQEETKRVAASLQEGYLEAGQGAHQITATGKTFDAISAAITQMAANIRKVAGNLSETATDSNQMNNSIEEIASIAEEAAAGVEQTSASVQQASSSMDEVAGSSEQLSILAGELNKLAAKFKL